MAKAPALKPVFHSLLHGTSFADWCAAAVVLEGCTGGDEVIIERPVYEPLLRIAEGFGVRIKRFDRRQDADYAIDVDRFASLVTPRTRLAMVTNLHNPSGAAIDARTLRAMAVALATHGAYLLVDAGADRDILFLPPARGRAEGPGESPGFDEVAGTDRLYAEAGYWVVGLSYALLRIQRTDLAEAAEAAVARPAQAVPVPVAVPVRWQDAEARS